MDRLRTTGTSGKNNIIASRSKGATMRHLWYSYPSPGYEVFQDGTTYTGPFSTVYYVPRSNLQSISDRIGFRGLYNPCFHSRVVPFDWRSVSFNADRTSAFRAAYTGTKVSTGYIPVDLGRITFTGEMNTDRFGGSVTNPGLCITAQDWSDLVYSVGSSLDGHMQARTNVLVVLAEAGQTAAMLKNPYKLLSPAHWRKELRTIRGLIRAGANVWLETKYGWSNLYRDVKALANSLHAARDHYAYLKQSLGRWSGVHGQKTASSILTPTTTSFTFGDSYLEIKATHVKTTFTDCAAFGCEILRSDAMKLGSIMDYVAQYSGVNQVVEALWDLFPFSFVVDWFVDIGNMIGRGPIFWNSHQTRRLGYSQKRTWETEMKITATFGGYGLMQPITVFSQNFKWEAIKSFQRWPGFPPDCDTVGLFGSLSLSNLADGAALMMQRLK